MYRTLILDLSYFLGQLMGVCACVMIGVGNNRGMYGI